MPRVEKKPYASGFAFTNMPSNLPWLAAWMAAAIKRLPIPV